MKANELRIGNLVKHKNHEKPFKVFIIDTTETSFSSNIEPIPLTEEWLVKLGFEKNETGFYYKGRFTYHNEYGWKILEQWVKNWVGVSELKYVHQLQNLYFALTGEELVCQ